MASTALPPSAGATLALASNARPRPIPIRRPTSQILSYYHSEAANAGDGEYSYMSEEDREENIDTIKWARQTVGTGKLSASPAQSFGYFEPDDDSRRVSVRDSAVTEGPIEYGIALGTPSGLLDRPGSSFFGSASRVHTATGCNEASSKPTPSVMVQAPALGHRRRTSARSSGGEDKRRVAVVEVDSASEAEQLSDNGMSRGQRRPAAAFVFPPSSSANSSTSSATRTASAETDDTNWSLASSSSILSRRGHHKVALLLPAASPSTIAKLSYFTPPLSAPVSVSVPSDHSKLSPPPLLRNESTNSNISAASVSSSVRQHKRSQSEAVLVTGRPSHSPPSGLGFEQPATPPTDNSARRGHKLRASSRDIGIVGAHFHSASPPPTAGPTSNASKMQVDTRPSGGPNPCSVPPDSNGASTQHTQQLSPIFQRPPLSQMSSYVSSTDGDVLDMSTHSTDQHTGAFSVFKDMNRRTLGQIDMRAAGNTATGSSSTKTDNLPSRGQDGQHHSSESKQAAHTSTSTPNTANDQLASSASNATSSFPPSQARGRNPYLHYQPGLHATAGPLPSPPKSLHPEPDSKKESPPPKPLVTSPAVGIGSAPPRPPRLHAPRDAMSMAKHHLDSTSRTPEAASPGSSTILSDQPSQATSDNAPVMPSTTSSTLVESRSETESSVKGKHTREGASSSPMASVNVQQSLPPSHDSMPRSSEEGGNSKLVSPSSSDLKRKNTMEDLVKDVTAAIDELSPSTSTRRTEIKSSSTGRPLTRERSATTVASTSETKLSSDASSRRTAMDDRTNKPSLTSHRSAIDLRREGSKNTFKGTLPPTRDGSDSDYSDLDYENITVSRVPNDPHYHVRSPGMHAPSASMSDSGHGYSSGGSTRTPQSPQSRMQDFASAIRRFSALPRTPSRLSVSRASQHSSSVGHDHVIHEQYASSSTAQLVPHIELPPRSKHYAPKIKSAWPEAMRFGDVLQLKTPLERSIGYARKINELANHDPGLGDWVISTKEDLTRAGTKRKSISPTASRSPAEQTAFQPRHVSRGSIGSEMTFPKRVDAYVATDLIPHEKSEEVHPRGPSIPYPTLPPAPLHHPTSVAAAASALLHPSSSTRQLPFGVRNLPGSLALSRSGTSTTNGAPPTAGNGNSGGGFFSSIGRKTSIKRDRPLGSGPPLHQPNKLLSRRQQNNAQPAPRAIQITASPSLPGGPRAPPGRAPPVARAQSVIAPKTVIGEATPIGSTFSGAETDVEPIKKRRLSIKRTGSVQPPPLPSRSTTLPPASVNPNTDALDLNLDAQLTKLSDLLPNANRAILEGYLRRAGGSEMLAIGRYLDDEKNGALRSV